VLAEVDEGDLLPEAQLSELLPDLVGGEDALNGLLRWLFAISGSFISTRSCISTLSALLYREIRRIPPLLRKVFELREMDELPMPEVAECLGITVAAAKSRLLRARAELRERLTRYCDSRGMAAPLGRGKEARSGRAT
jgi:hypothetical protein